MLRFKVFLSGRVLGTSAGRFSTGNEDTTGENRRIWTNSTGLRNKAVEGLFLVSDGLDNLRVSRWEVSM